MYSKIVLLVCFASCTQAILDSLFMQLDISCTTPDSFTCRNSKCVPRSKRCDGHPDCLDSSDEEDCDVFLCREPNYFKCNNGKCISTTFRCDDENDCGDYSDESNCTNFKYMLAHPSNCSESEWQCVDHLCIPKDFVCNGENDCLDGTDETIGCTFNMECDGFKCHDGHCVPNEWRCDGLPDCHDKSDEMECDSHIKPADCTMENSKFLCGNNLTCIDLNKVCDGDAHCPDKSDELRNCSQRKECAAKRCSHLCIELPTGAKCSCPKGYRTVNENDCRDINECEEYGICDQKCRNLPGSYECYCDAKYTLQADNKTCKVVGGEALMIFSSKTEIRGYFLETELLYPIAQNLKQVVGVNFDGHHVYWTDIHPEHESLVKALEDGSQRELLVTSGLGSPEDLAIDWVTGNIYFTDSEMQHIGVCTNDGSACTVLVNKDIHKPRGIALHPSDGSMFWTDWDTNPEIAKSNMDGTGDYSFVSTDIHWPNGIVIDFPNERLYWTDGKLMTLESIRLDGTDRKMVLEGIVRHPYAIAVFENRLFWSDWATYSIQSCDKFTGKNHTTLIKEKREHIYGLHIFHSALKPTIVNPCKNSLCSDMCLIGGPKKYTCVCPVDKTLSGDMHTCKELTQRPLLAVAAKDMLIKVEHQKLGKQAITALPTIAKEIGALAYDPNNHTVFVSDIGGSKRIVSMDINSGFSDLILKDNLGHVNSMAFDYLGNNLYWCDSDRKTIELFNMNTRTRKVVLHDLGGEIPMSIALIPEEGVLFLASHKGRMVHIDRMSMDGTMRTHIIESGLLGPISLHYDSLLNRIVWADAGTGHIESTSAEGDDRHGFKALHTTPVSVASLGDEIFWTNHNSRRVYWSKSTGNFNNNKKVTLDLPKDIEILHLESITPFKATSHMCRKDNGGCSHICIPQGKSAVCTCPLGMTLSPKSNTTCIKRTECTSSEFYCLSSDVCIPRALKCNGRNDCLMGEDEHDCLPNNHCPSGYFQCSNGKCIRNNLVCDMHFDCEDRSDENDCKTHRSKSCDGFQCNNGDCINERFVCDGMDDCHEGEDERECNRDTCSAEQFRCASGSCIPKNWECDREYDCVDMSDEHANCRHKTCAKTQFTCDNGLCVDSRLRCNNIDDCGDNSDETRCSSQAETSDGCRPNEFQCTSNSTICLPALARCNGTSECPHHEDEQGCSDCHIDEYECKNKKCVPRMWLCDNHDDCGDNSDEDICNANSSDNEGKLMPCESGFRCKNGGCVDFKLLCNGVEDCHDGSDEHGSCPLACKGRTTNPCDQVCIPTPTGPMCACNAGFELSGDGQTCHDIPECSQDPPICSQLCTEHIGSFSCSCYEGFLIRSDKVSCKSTGEAMSMLFTANNEIRQLSQADHSIKILHMEDTPRISGIDVSVKDNYIYYSIEESGSIHRINLENGTREFISDLGRPQKVAVDWITKNIYFVEAESKIKSIQVCNFNQQRCAKIIDIDPHTQVTSLVIDATNKYLFYSITTWWIFNNPQSVIYKANMDGRNIHELVKATSGHVSGVAVDYRRKILYYADQHANSIGRVHYDGSEKSTIITNVTRPNGLSLFEDQLYFMTSYGYMGKCQLFGTERSCTTFRLNAYSSELFAIAQESRQTEGKNACNGHSCNHLCVPNDFGASCLCENGRIVDENVECEDTHPLGRSADGDIRRPTFGVHPDSSSSNTKSVLAGVLIPVCIVLIAFGAFYVVKKRNSGQFNVSMRFHNPIYGVEQQGQSDRTVILNPGEHEYCNPVDVFNKASSDHESLMKFHD